MITYQPKKLIMEDWSGASQPTHFKPRGVWVSPKVEGGVTAWRRWCEGERWNPGGYTHKYQLTGLNYCSLEETLWGEGGDKILLLSSEEEMREFTLAFQADDDGSHIQWDRVSILCNGICIIPYQWRSRDLGWYYYWDLASGCIWKKTEAMSITEMTLDWDGWVEEEWDWYDDED